MGIFGAFQFRLVLLSSDSRKTLNADRIEGVVLVMSVPEYDVGRSGHCWPQFSFYPFGSYKPSLLLFYDPCALTPLRWRFADATYEFNDEGGENRNCPVGTRCSELL